MKKISLAFHQLPLVVIAVFLSARIETAQAMIDGVTGPTFTLSAKAGVISTADGNSIYAWGFANGNGPMQYPGVTMIVNEGDTVSVNLLNTLSVPVSIVFPGQEGISATGDVDGVLTKEAAPGGGSATYSFVAKRPGTFMYQSGTRPEIQVEMGLVGALIVRPKAAAGHAMHSMAYTHMDSAYDREELFLLTEMDPRIHQTVELLGIEALNNTDHLTEYFPVYWFINGRNAPDTMLDAGVPWLPSQPYNSMPMMHPGEKLLLRIIGAGRDLHPFHTHGNHARIIAKNAQMLESASNSGADLSYEVFTVQSVPGETVDAIFEWTGKGLGWDIYGHQPGDALEPAEYAADHGKPFPVTLPEKQNLTFGGYYSGSPFLGMGAQLPPGQGGMNPNSGFVHMWHSHTEKEMTNFDIFPGGMMTMLIIEAPGVAIAH